MKSKYNIKIVKGGKNKDDFVEVKIPTKLIRPTRAYLRKMREMWPESNKNVAIADLRAATEFDDIPVDRATADFFQTIDAEAVAGGLEDANTDVVFTNI